MRTKFVSTAAVDTVVTLAAAAMMTFAGLAMLDDIPTMPVAAPTLVTHAVAPPASG